MELPIFKIIKFEYLPFPIAAEFLRKSNLPKHLPDEKILEIWYDEFREKRDRFYMAQMNWINLSFQNAFYTYYHIPEDESVSCNDLSEEWNYYRQESGLTDRIEELEELLTLRQPRLPQVYSVKEVAELAKEYIKSAPFPLRLNELWFNWEIDNPRALQKELRDMPYSHYLKTDQWQKVRMAMIMIHGCKCQEEKESEFGESYYPGDWVSEIHVHHLSYANRGNERYADLKLLCSNHHKKYHDEVNQTGVSSMKFFP